MAAEIPGAAPVSFAAAAPGRQRLPAAGASYYSMAQAEIAGFALAIHTAPRQPERLTELEVHVAQHGKLHLVRACYRFPGPRRGDRLAIGEDKLLTAGGFYSRTAEYAALMRQAVAAKPEPARRPRLQRVLRLRRRDQRLRRNASRSPRPSRSCRRAGSTRPSCAPCSTATPTIISSTFVAGHYQGKNTIMSRQLAFVILAVATMYRATGDEAYRDQLRRLCDALLDFEVRFNDVAGQPASGFPYGIGTHRSAFVDGHSASLLALTQAARYLPDPRLAAAIDRGLAGFCIETTTVMLDRPVKIDTGVDQHRRRARQPVQRECLLEFQCRPGLAFVRRAARIARPGAAADRGAAPRPHRAVGAGVALAIAALDHRARGQSSKSAPSIYSGETNSETQPWVMLGLLGGHPYD